MKTLPILVLLSSVAQLCSAAAPLEPLTCSEDGGAAAARLAMHHINEHHDHGYKFRQREVTGSTLEKVDDGCNIELQLDLSETKCHTINPKHFEDCKIRDEPPGVVVANCTVTMTVKNSDAKVTKYDCSMGLDTEAWSRCADCPVMISVNNAEALRAARVGVAKFNENSTNQHIYVLQEMGRYIPMTGMFYATEFVLVETRCPWGTKIAPEACKPLCPDRAHHAFCEGSYTNKRGLSSFKCELYPPTNTTALGPGEQEPICRPPHHVMPPPSPPAGPPGHANGQDPPPHAGGPPPRAGGHLPLHPFPPCNGVLTNVDPAIHPICPWPLPEPRTIPTQEAS
ncbi:alpha-2-HS-glycoprotein 1 [Symphorus nematophorus]